MSQLFIVELSTKEMQTINGGGNVLWAALGRLIKKAVQDYKDHFFGSSVKCVDGYHVMHIVLM